MVGRIKLGAQALAVGLVVALLGLLAWKLVHNEAGSPPIGSPAPAFTLPRLPTAQAAPARLSLTGLRGKAVVLNFWASWCFPCKQEAATLERTWREHRNDGLVVVGVNFNDLAPDARRFMTKQGITYPVVVDRDGGVVAKYGLTGVPETFFVDRRGRLVGRHIAGPVNEGKFRGQFEEGVRLALRS